MLTKIIEWFIPKIVSCQCVRPATYAAIEVDGYTTHCVYCQSCNVKLEGKSRRDVVLKWANYRIKQYKNLKNNFNNQIDADKRKEFKLRENERV